MKELIAWTHRASNDFVKKHRNAIDVLANRLMTDRDVYLEEVEGILEESARVAYPGYVTFRENKGLLTFNSSVLATTEDEVLTTTSQ